MRINKLTTDEVSPTKVYVPVSVVFDANGKMTPTQLMWTDGQVYKIDRCGQIVRSAALKAGGSGDRYEIYINGKQSFIFFEREARFTGAVAGKWFVEKRAEES